MSKRSDHPFGERTTLADLRERYKSLGRVLDRAELPALPRPQPLIEGWADTRSSVVVIGATGTNKTFTLIGWACSTATGEPWLGHAVAIEPCPVIYVVGEGASGFDARIAAWEATTGVVVPEGRLLLLMQPESLRDPAFWEELQALAVDVGSRLIILDTFSSLAPDADETKDAAAVIRRMSMLSVTIDGVVVLAHHTGWGPQDRARGGSQLEANPDSTIVLQKLDPDEPNGVVSILRKKDKDGPSGKRIHVMRLPVENSCVLEMVDAPPETTKKRGDGPVREAIRSVLLSQDEFSLTSEQVIKQVGGSAPTARRVLSALVADGTVLQEHRPRAEGDRTRHRDLLAYNDLHKAFRVGDPTPTNGRSGLVGEARRDTASRNPDPKTGRGSRGQKRSGR
jgi:hypothetical protein